MTSTLDFVNRIKASVPCGQTTGHGEACSVGRLCGPCALAAEAADLLVKLELANLALQEKNGHPADKLQRLLARCKCGVFLEVNQHRDYYQSVEEALGEMAALECPPEIPEDVRAQMIATDTIVDLQFYPDTPIGSYSIVHHDLDAALDIALHTLGIEP